MNCQNFHGRNLTSTSPSQRKGLIPVSGCIFVRKPSEKLREMVRLVHSKKSFKNRQRTRSKGGITATADRPSSAASTMALSYIVRTKIYLTENEILKMTLTFLPEQQQLFVLQIKLNQSRCSVVTTFPGSNINEPTKVTPSLR